jgi:type II secretory pathway component GspD/PulD (secretin)
LDGTVIAKDGLTIAVGGLVRETKSTQESKVPWLSDIPLIGKLFTSTQDLEERSELILMITPHVMITPDDYSKNYTVNDANNTLSPQINKDTHADNIQSFRCLEQCRL